MAQTLRFIKKIPIGGGLGGGSSNAATTLVALNHLWQLNLSKSELMKMGVQLGADVPIFIYGRTAWAEGIGEKLEALTLPERWFVVMVPPCSISTAEIFSATELTRNSPAITIQQFLETPEMTRNDCESVVKQRYPIIATALNWLNQFSPARLTGTGGCIFTSVENKTHAQKITQKIPEPFQGFFAKGLNNNYWGVAKR